MLVSSADSTVKCQQNNSIFLQNLWLSVQKWVNSVIKGFLNYIERVLAGVNKSRFFFLYIISSTSFNAMKSDRQSCSSYFGKVTWPLWADSDLPFVKQNSIETGGTCPYNSNHSLHNFSQEVEWSVAWLLVGTLRRLVIQEVINWHILKGFTVICLRVPYRKLDISSI